MLDNVVMSRLYRPGSVSWLPMLSNALKRLFKLRALGWSLSDLKRFEMVLEYFRMFRWAFSVVFRAGVMAMLLMFLVFASVTLSIAFFSAVYDLMIQGFFRYHRCSTL